MTISTFRSSWTGQSLAQLANHTRMMVLAWLLGGLLFQGLGYFGTLLLGGGVFVVIHLAAYWRTPELRRQGQQLKLHRGW